MTFVRSAVVVAGLLFSLGTQASPATDTLGRCLLDYTTGKDRKDLAKWIFVGMSAHPEIGAIARASPRDIETAQRTMGNLFTRLVTDQCASQMTAVIRTEGSDGVKIAFEHLGKMAMQELMSNPEVNAAMGGFERFIDKAKLDRVLNAK